MTYRRVQEGNWASPGSVGCRAVHLPWPGRSNQRVVATRERATSSHAQRVQCVEAQGGVRGFCGIYIIKHSCPQRAGSEGAGGGCGPAGVAGESASNCRFHDKAVADAFLSEAFSHSCCREPKRYRVPFVHLRIQTRQTYSQAWNQWSAPVPDPS